MNKQTSEKAGAWWASYDAITYTSGPHATREQAIFAGREDFDGVAFYIVEAAIEPFKFSAERLIEDQYFEADRLFHEADEADRRGNHAAADAELQEMLDAWLVRHADTFVTPSAFTWSRNEELIPAGAVGEREAA